MIERGPATEDEMVLAFLRAEIDSSRYDEFIATALVRLGFTRRLIDEPDLTDGPENAGRKRLLAFRGYESREALFTGFPSDVRWRRVAFEAADFETLRYANYKTWVELSEGTRLVSVGVRSFLQCPDDPGTYQINGIAAALRNCHRFPPLIAIEGADLSLILVEGHSRATAYMLENRTAEVEALVGSSPAMHRWAFY
jgi:hypothetical protein